MTAHEVHPELVTKTQRKKKKIKGGVYDALRAKEKKEKNSAAQAQEKTEKESS